MADGSYEVGYGKPPRHTRFKKGRSGNPRGRPKGAKNLSTLFERELNERIMVTEAGRKRSLTKAEAFIKRLMNDGILGKPSAQRLLMDYKRQLESAVSDADIGDQEGSAQRDVDRQVLDAFKRALLDAAEDATRSETHDDPEPARKARVRSRSRRSQPEG